MWIHLNVVDGTTVADILSYALPGIGMITVAAIAVLFWRRLSGVAFRWFCVGVGLWAIGCTFKLLGALATNDPVVGFMKGNFPPFFLLLGWGLFCGVGSSVCEMGITWIAVLIWPQIGRDATRAIGIGVGAGAFEALVIGLYFLIVIVAFTVGVPGLEEHWRNITNPPAFTPLVWLYPAAERTIAILCHTSSRALILLGATRKKPSLVFCGFSLFALMDGTACAFLISKKLETGSLWWLGLACLPYALVSIPILRWCYMRWGDQKAHMKETTQMELQS